MVNDDEHKEHENSSELIENIGRIIEGVQEKFQATRDTLNQAATALEARAYQRAQYHWSANDNMLQEFQKTITEKNAKLKQLILQKESLKREIKTLAEHLMGIIDA
jgi:CBS-domain-containing membrane protein